MSQKSLEYLLAMCSSVVVKISPALGITQFLSPPPRLPSSARFPCLHALRRREIFHVSNVVGLDSIVRVCYTVIYRGRKSFVIRCVPIRFVLMLILVGGICLCFVFRFHCLQPDPHSVDLRARVVLYGANREEHRDCLGIGDGSFFPILGKKNRPQLMLRP